MERRISIGRHHGVASVVGYDFFVAEIPGASKLASRGLVAIRFLSSQCWKIFMSRLYAHFIESISVIAWILKENSTTIVFSLGMELVLGEAFELEIVVIFVSERYVHEDEDECGSLVLS